MKCPRILGPVMILASVTAKANLGGPAVICHLGKAYVQDVTWDTGCVYPATPFFKSLFLNGDSPEKGKIDIEMGYTFRTKNPHCDNPRGMPHFFSLPLLVDKGTWQIEIAGQVKALLTFEPSCHVQN